MIIINNVTLIGRLTKEVELKFTSNSNAVGTFTLAVNSNFKNDAGKYEADFINCVVWRKAAENLANFTRKGSQIGVEGRIQTRNYENQQGQRVYVTEVLVSNFHLLEPKQDTQQQGQGNCQQNNYNAQNNQFKPNNGQQSPYMQDGRPIDISEDDLPFENSPVK